MITVGIRELKAKLSSYIGQAREGEEILVTDHGVEVAVIKQITAERRVIMKLVKDGTVQWSGGKPGGIEGIAIRGQAISKTVLEERQ